MSLAPGEQRALTEIESRLRESDPQLDAMFARFASKGPRGRGEARELLSSWRSFPTELTRIIAVAVGVALLIACAIAGAISTSHAGPSQGNFGPGSVITPMGRR